MKICNMVNTGQYYHQLQGNFFTGKLCLIQCFIIKKFTFFSLQCNCMKNTYYSFYYSIINHTPNFDEPISDTIIFSIASINELKHGLLSNNKNVKKSFSKFSTCFKKTLVFILLQIQISKTLKTKNAKTMFFAV